MSAGNHAEAKFTPKIAIGGQHKRETPASKLTQFETNSCADDPPGGTNSSQRSRAVDDKTPSPTQQHRSTQESSAKFPTYIPRIRSKFANRPHLLAHHPDGLARECSSFNHHRAVTLLSDGTAALQKPSVSSHKVNYAYDRIPPPNPTTSAHTIYSNVASPGAFVRDSRPSTSGAGRPTLNRKAR